MSITRTCNAACACACACVCVCHLNAPLDISLSFEYWQWNRLCFVFFGFKYACMHRASVSRNNSRARVSLFVNLYCDSLNVHCVWMSHFDYILFIWEINTTYSEWVVPFRLVAAHWHERKCMFGCLFAVIWNRKTCLALSLFLILF